MKKQTKTQILNLGKKAPYKDDDDDLKTDNDMEASELDTRSN